MRQQLVEKYRPKRIADFIGLERPKAILNDFIKDPYPIAFFMLGPSGLGKTTLSMAVADALKGAVHHMPSRQCNLETVEHLLKECRSYPMFAESHWHVPIVDEADQMSKPAQLAFLSALDSTAMPENMVAFFTANDTRLLESRFMSRVKLLRFTIDDAKAPFAEFLARIWKKEHGPKQAPDFARLFELSGYNVRTAINNLEMALMDPGYVDDLMRVPDVAPQVVSISAGRQRKTAERCGRPRSKRSSKARLGYHPGEKGSGVL